MPNVKGAVSVARTSDPDSGMTLKAKKNSINYSFNFFFSSLFFLATSEFSIMLGDNSKWLGPGGSDKYGYAVFMKVVRGWDTIDAIMKHGKNYHRTPFLSIKTHI